MALVAGILLILILILVLIGLASVGRQLYRHWQASGSARSADPPTWRAEPMNNEFSGKLNLRFISIAVITLLMFIPLCFVSDLVDERHGYYRSVIDEIAGLWGRQQVLKGPALIIPFVEEWQVEETVRTENGGERKRLKTVRKTRHAVALPKNLEMDMDLDASQRHRGIYDALVYTADVIMQGEFAIPDIGKLSSHLHHVNWDKAYLSFSITDTRAINRPARFSWNGTVKTVEPGTGLSKLLGHGIHVPLELNAGASGLHAFRMDLGLNGSSGLRFAPFGEVTRVNMNSAWPHPKFTGDTLPDRHDIRHDGFSAFWEIPHIARNYPQVWVHETMSNELDELLAGVDLFEPVFMYSEITRAVKYGILFIVLTYLTFLVFELSTRAGLHLVQYGLIGMALALFYLMLLSLAEHIGFLWAYVFASGINITLICAYTVAALKSHGLSAGIFALLSALYVLLYGILQLEDYALLMGTGLLLVVLMALMYLTRHLRAAIPAK